MADRITEKNLRIMTENLRNQSGIPVYLHTDTTISETRNYYYLTLENNPGFKDSSAFTNRCTNLEMKEVLTTLLRMGWRRIINNNGIAEIKFQVVRKKEIES